VTRGPANLIGTQSEEEVSTMTYEIQNLSDVAADVHWTVF
jgi:hypothetical protein